jgi:hypothetical protein
MKNFLLFAAAIMLFGSCEKDVSLSASNHSDAALKKYADIASNALSSSNNGAVNPQEIIDGQVTRPLKNSGSGTISYYPGGCGAGTLQLISVGTGNSTALGAFTQTTTVCITNGVPTSVVGVGIAANGDALNYIFTGQGIDPATGFTYQDYIIAGGSGRFANASGNITLLYSVRTPTNFTYTGEGTITY